MGSVWKVTRKLIRMAVLSYEKVDALLHWAFNIYYDLIFLEKKKRLYKMFSPDAALSVFGVALHISQIVGEYIWRRRVLN